MIKMKTWPSSLEPHIPYIPAANHWQSRDNTSLFSRLQQEFIEEKIIGNGPRQCHQGKISIKKTPHFPGFP